MATSRNVRCSVNAAHFTDGGSWQIAYAFLVKEGDPPMSARSTIEATSITEVLAEVERLADTLGFDCAGSATVTAGRKFNGFYAATRSLHFKGRGLHPYYVRNPR